MSIRASRTTRCRALWISRRSRTQSSAAAFVNHREGPYGAKGFSEGSMLPIAPAVANAIKDAVGIKLLDLPITKEKMLKALKEAGKAA